MTGTDSTYGEAFERLVEEVDLLIRHTPGGVALNRAWTLGVARAILVSLVKEHGVHLSGMVSSSPPTWTRKEWPRCVDRGCAMAPTIHILGPGCRRYDAVREKMTGTDPL
jgi:hypothetical protein